MLADAPDDTTLSAGSRTTVDGQCVPTDAPTSHAELSTHSVPRCGRRPSATTPAVAAGPSAATSAAAPAAGSACCDTAAAASCCDASA